MRRVTASSLTALAVLAGACGGDRWEEVPPEASDAVVRDSAGVRVVENGPPPAGAWRVASEPLFTVGWDPRGPALTWPQSGRILPDGGALIGDYGSGTIYRIGPDGRVVATWGRKGEVPGRRLPGRLRLGPLGSARSPLVRRRRAPRPGRPLGRGAGAPRPGVPGAHGPDLPGGVPIAGGDESTVAAQLAALDDRLDRHDGPLPYWSELHVDRRGNVWLGEYVPTGEPPGRWRVITRDGVVAGPVELPGVLTLLDVADGRLLGIRQDDSTCPPPCCWS